MSAMLVGRQGLGVACSSRTQSKLFAKPQPVQSQRCGGQTRRCRSPALITAATSLHQLKFQPIYCIAGGIDVAIARAAQGEHRCAGDPAKPRH